MCSNMISAGSEGAVAADKPQRSGGSGAGIDDTLIPAAAETSATAHGLITASARLLRTRQR